VTTGRPVGEPGLPVLAECCAPGCSCCGAQVEPRRGADWYRAARTARWLSWISLAWMTAEGTLGLIAGINGGSVSLTGWALGSVIEALASVIVIWRFTGSRTDSEHAEQRAQIAVAVSFFLLAPYITAEAVQDLVTEHRASTSALGLAVTASSLILMPALGYAKRRLGTRLDSGATAGEGTQNLMCAAQAGAVLSGLAVTAARGWTWLDPAVALLLAVWAVREGVSAWRGEDCC
jgi:divalent metal cation (Fe/Co/Zn/Cd) transporter